MGRSPCCDKENVKRGPWSPEEDAKLKQYIEANGTGGNWIALPNKVGLRRCGKSCRLRWLNYLRPNIKHGDFSDHEDWVISTLYANIGSRWSIISAQLPGRTDNDIKNYWNTKLKKKLTTSLPVPAPPLASYSTLNYQPPPANFFSPPVPSNFFTTPPHPTDQFNCFNNNNNDEVKQQQYCYDQVAAESSHSEGASSSDASFINKTINGVIDDLDTGTVLLEDYYLSAYHGIMENPFEEGSSGLEEIKEVISSSSKNNNSMFKFNENLADEESVFLF